MWASAKSRICVPGPADQRETHRIVYKLKRGADPTCVVRPIEDMCERNGANGWIAGCTEFHLVAKAIASAVDGFGVVDPLSTLAKAAASPEGLDLLAERMAMSASG